MDAVAAAAAVPTTLSSLSDFDLVMSRTISVKAALGMEDRHSGEGRIGEGGVGDRGSLFSCVSAPRLCRSLLLLSHDAAVARASSGYSGGGGGREEEVYDMDEGPRSAAAVAAAVAGSEAATCCAPVTTPRVGVAAALLEVGIGTGEPSAVVTEPERRS